MEETRHRKTNIACSHSYVELKKKERDKYRGGRELIGAYQSWEGAREERSKEVC